MKTTDAKQPMPSIGKILEHWSTPEGRTFLFEKIGFNLDRGEPTCMACGWFWDGRYDVCPSGTRRNTPVKAWESAPLQRCHIVPRSLGGTNEPSNLLLLCRECHDLAPDSTDPVMLFRWCQAQSWVERKLKKVEQAFSAFGINIYEQPEIADRLCEILKSEQFKAWAVKNVGFHFMQDGNPSELMSVSSWVAGLLTYAEKVEALEIGKK